MSLLKRSIICLLILASLVFSSATIASAAYIQDAGVGGGASETTWQKFSESVNDPQGKIDIFAWSGFPLTGFLCHAISLGGGYPDENGQVSIASIQKSLLGGLAMGINNTYKKPLSSTEYIAYVSGKFNPVKPAYAQAGSGFDFLKPILKIWTITRDLSYILFIIVFVAIGFSIMFRSKLDPQTSASIQSAIPKIVISLILVTFSYAIAGLAVDLVFLLNSLVINTILSKDVDIRNTIYTVVNSTLGQNKFLDTVNVDILIEIFWQQISKITVGNFLGQGLGVLLGLVFIGVVVSTAFKLFLTLLSKYINIIMMTAISPFAFLLDAVPGQKVGGGVIKSLISSALTFPAVLLVINLAVYIGHMGSTFYDLPPFTLNILSGSNNISGAAALNPNQLVALGIFLSTPKIPELIDGMFKADHGGFASGISPELGSALKRIPVIGGMIG